MNICYRHPERETGVSCQRCGRFICPDCATPGAVGFLCPEDSKDRVKIQRPAFQQSLTQRAPVTMSLVGINIIVFVLQISDSAVTTAIGFWRVGSEYEYGNIIRAFTSAFAHSPTQYTHILFNMYSLFVLGTLIEPLLGKLKFSVLYFLSIFGGSLGFLFFGDFGSYVVGASGAIFGLMGAYIVFLRALRMDARQMIAIVAINVVISFLPGIAWQAHFGGMAVGALVAYIYTLFTRENQKAMLWGAIAVVVVGLFGLWVLGNAMMPPINIQ
ncbi:MAG: rhomboid family intramembrane serine protease [Rhodoluna sp.]